MLLFIGLGTYVLQDIFAESLHFTHWYNDNDVEILTLPAIALMLTLVYQRQQYVFVVAHTKETQSHGKKSIVACTGERFP